MEKSFIQNIPYRALTYFWSIAWAVGFILQQLNRKCMGLFALLTLSLIPCFLIAQKNVGIGTSTPASRLHVHQGNVLSDPISALHLTNAQTGELHNDGMKLSSTLQEGHLINYENNFLHLGTNGQNRLSILGNGRVGLNTTTMIGAADFVIRSYSTAGFGGMYVDVPNPSSGQPFYGYATNGGVRAYHYFDATNSTWVVNNGGNHLNLKNTGQLGLGTTNPHPSAILDLSSTNKGVLLPRMTANNRINIATPTNGLIVFDTTHQGLYTFSNGAWKRAGENVWSIDGSQNISYSGGTVTIGSSPATANSLSVVTQNTENVGIHTISDFSGALSKTGILAEATADGTGIKYAIFGRATAPSTGSNATFGVYGEVLNNTSNGNKYGVFGIANGTDGGSSEGNYGVYGQASGQGYGIYGKGSGGSAEAGFFNGNVTVDGDESNGQNSALLIKNGIDSLILDGNEIDALRQGLRLNQNTNQNVYIATGGGNVGIGTSMLFSDEKLKVQGKVVATEAEVSNLSGIGKRNVIADEDGVLKIDDKEHIYTVTAYDFQSSNNNNDFYIHESQGAGILEALPPAEGFIAAPIHLPNGSIIKSITYYYYDVDSPINSDIRIKFVASDVAATSQIGLLSFQSSTGSSSIQSHTINGLSINIDNVNKYYWLKVDNFNPLIMNNVWTGRSIKAAVIKYIL